MRRALAWIGAIILVLGLTLLVLAVLGANRSPFDFLEGQDALVQPPAMKKELEEYEADAAVYSFKKDPAALERRATAELSAAGYTNISDTRQQRIGELMFAKGDVSGLKKALQAGVPFPRGVQVVLIARDKRFKPGGAAYPIPSKGWVTVLVGGNRDKGLFRRFQDWLGF